MPFLLFVSWDDILYNFFYSSCYFGHLQFPHHHPTLFCFDIRDDALHYLLPAAKISRFIVQKRDCFLSKGSEKVKFSLFSLIQLDTSPYDGIVCFQYLMKWMSSCHLDFISQVKQIRVEDYRHMIIM